MFFTLPASWLPAPLAHAACPAWLGLASLTSSSALSPFFPLSSARRELGRDGCRSLLAVPISFVSEHIETLEEIDMEYRELAEVRRADGRRRARGGGALRKSVRCCPGCGQGQGST